MSNVAFERQVFVNDMSIKLGYEPEHIKKLLTDMYKSFDPDKISEYETYLVDCRSRTKLSLSSDEPKVVHAIGFMCPICGANTIVDDRWFGRYTRTPGWRCAKEGITHFLYWKANNIRRNQGLPIVFPEMENSNANG